MAMSSISGRSGKPPTASNALRVTKIAWSPVATPVRRERQLIMRAITVRSGWLSGNAQVETAPRAACQGRIDQAIGAVRQRRVGVQEEERVAGAERGAGIHRRAAPAPDGDDAIGERLGEARGAVAAAAVGDDDLGAAGAQRRQRRQRGNDDRRLVEHRNDNGEPTHGAWHAHGARHATGLWGRSVAVPLSHRT